MATLSALLFENGLPNLPVLLIEPHRNPRGIWRIKFSYETSEALSMSAVQASTMASSLQEMGEVELADEIDRALKSAARYASM
jgi:esterase/lipase superfamily enzyme